MFSCCHRNMKEFLSFNVTMAILGFGTIASFMIPILMKWKMIELEKGCSPPVLTALQSNQYQIALVVSMSVSAPMLVELILRILTAKLEFVLPNAVILASLAIPDLIILFFVRIFLDLNALNYMLRTRTLLCILMAFIFIMKYGGSQWSNKWLMSSFVLACVARITAFYRVYMSHGLHDSFALLGLISDALAFSIFVVMSLNWYRFIFRERKIATLTTHQYMCNVYVTATLMTCIGIYVTVYSSPSALDWYQWNSIQLALYSAFFTLFYVIVIVFEGRVLQREMLQTKVSINITNSFHRLCLLKYYFRWSWRRSLCLSVTSLMRSAILSTQCSLDWRV